MVSAALSCVACLPTIGVTVATATLLTGRPAQATIVLDWVTVGNRYAVRSNMGDKPVNFVSWFDAARVSNWLHNGAQTYGTTNSGTGAPQNTGAYTLGTATSGTAPAQNVGAQYYIPTENEWYKAAYYNPTLNTGAGGYRVYGNGFDSAPTAEIPMYEAATAAPMTQSHQWLSRPGTSRHSSTVRPRASTRIGYSADHCSESISCVPACTVIACGSAFGSLHRAATRLFHAFVS